jgi:hypothetical protein
LIAHGRWFSPGIPASSTTNTDRHDIAEILLKVALNTINQSINQSIYYMMNNFFFSFFLGLLFNAKSTNEEFHRTNLHFYNKR